MSVAASLLAAPPAHAALPASKTQIIQTILRDTNEIRRSVGLSPLILNTAINTVAENWSKQQAANGAMSHNPNYSKQIPSGWRGAAENVAYGYRYTEVTTAWKNSPGHYKNIVGDYTDIGIGIAESANGTLYYTQNFGRYPGNTISGAPTPVVVGNKLQDARTGAAWSAKAVNWPSFEYACQQGWGYSAAGATSAAASAMTSWGITAVRLPLNQDCWLGVDGQPAFGSASGYRSAVAAFVGALNAAGLVVILDLHWSGPAGAASDGQRAMPDGQSTTFWSQVAAAYKGNSSVMFDLFNEPYSRDGFALTWDCWKNGGCQAPVEADGAATSGGTYAVTGMATLVSAVRAAGASQPILLGGLDYANDLRGWLTNRPSDDQLVASWHNYPQQRCSSTTCWNSEVKPVAASVPVIATEFGQSDGGSAFLDSFLDWADAAGVGYAPWAWWSVSSSESPENANYALITDTNTFTAKAPSGTAFRDHLSSSVPAARSDFSGDGTPDVLVRNPGGALVLYAGDGRAGWRAPRQVGSGWGGMSALTMTSDFDGDGFTDVLARDGRGSLWLYPGDGKSGWKTPRVVGSGWNGMTSIIAAGDWNGDDLADVLARRSDGKLVLYPGDGRGGWGSARTIGSGWQIFTSVFAAGDFDGDGFPDLLARTSGGDLVLYSGDGRGGWITGTPVRVGVGWQGFTALTAPGDLDHDGAIDLLARSASGELIMYQSNGKGGWNGRRTVGYGWTGLDFVHS
ncbi:cellulase family glycosylhydrolase [Schumannella sp. 10F1B-5-1]|uniref:cellulase family glycosylhydrolase n=1 Tax=Schumannella sp. 10F1B-5-1 TaxID=2590780 RepID=UPI0011303C34|nr:cellulase family glycosylhydrolase [Schumannella sp. 10F1B-5-1]TPW78472.1 cellulase family glycosylhydrolase [Schumannella sp. 10F1B-5-1]